MDALAWAQSASLEGRRVSRKQIEETLGLSPRGFDKRMSAVDGALALYYSNPAPDVSVFAHSELLAIILLVEAAQASDVSDFDVADGLYWAAADLEGLKRELRRQYAGHDRTVRRRVKVRALARGIRGTPPRLSRPHITSAAPPAVPMPYHLSDDPSIALEELERAWRSGDDDALPLLLNNAMDVTMGRAGSAYSQWLLEVGCNVMRDSESLHAVSWATSWIGANLELSDAAAFRGVAQGLKTRAHVLQLHGFLGLAQSDLAQAVQKFSHINQDEIGDFALLRSDLVIRKAALDILCHKPREAANDLRCLLDSDVPDRMLLSAQRYVLHAESVWAAQQMERRSWSARRPLGYERALTRLIDLGERAPKAASFAVLDTIIASAIRVGDISSIREVVEREPWDASGSGPNVAARLRAHLRVASKLPGLGDLSDIVVPSRGGGSLRRAILLPPRLEFQL